MVEQEYLLLSIIDLLQAHRKNVSKGTFSQIFENKWLNRIFLFALFSYGSGSYIAIYCMLFLDKRVPCWLSMTGLACIVFGVLGYLVCGIFDIKDMIATFIDPLHSYLPSLSSKIKSEEALIAGLCSFDNVEIQKAIRRLEFDKTIISNRIIWFLGSSSKIAFVPVAALGIYIALSFIHNTSLSPSLGGLALAGIFGLSMGALISLRVSNTIDHFIYCLKEVHERKGEARSSSHIS